MKKSNQLTTALLLIFVHLIAISPKIVAQNTYLMNTQEVSDCEGILYDSGGLDLPYADGENSIFTVCPQPPPTCINLTFDTIALETNKDRLFIFHGKADDFTQKDSITGTFTNLSYQIKKECLTFQFLSDASATDYGWAASWTCFIEECPALAPSPQDCINAIPICKDEYFSEFIDFNSGNIPNEINPESSCLGVGERNNVWYTFTVLGDGKLNFSIIPNSSDDDYDWAVFNLTNAECSDIFTTSSLEIACNYAPAKGITGANGLAGAQNEAEIPVQKNETYVINVSQFSPSTEGYTIDFQSSSAVIFNDQKPFLSEIITPDCSNNMLELVMSENVLCSTLAPDDFMILGAGTFHTIQNIASNACELGSEYDRFFTITVEPDLLPNVDYRFISKDTLTDLCGNVAEIEPDTLLFSLVSDDEFIGSLADITLCQSGNTTISPLESSTYNFFDSQNNFLANGASYQPLSLDLDSTYVFFVEKEKNNCQNPIDTVEVRINSKDIAVFEISNVICIAEQGAVDNVIPTLLEATLGGTFSSEPPLDIDANTGEIVVDNVAWDRDYVITYETSSESSCRATYSQTIRFVGVELTDLNEKIGLNDSYYLSDEAVVLAYPNVVFEGSGVVNGNTFVPAVAGVGVHELDIQYVEPEFNCNVSLARTVTVLEDIVEEAFVAFLPTAFSPNNDGVNDFFALGGSGILSASILVYNRWGKVVFEEAAFHENAWDGMQSNSLAAAGMANYFYKMMVVFDNNEQEVVSGSLTLIR